jgi:hypothetical protein
MSKTAALQIPCGYEVALRVSVALSRNCAPCCPFLTGFSVAILRGECIQITADGRVAVVPKATMEA